jgi:polygalacturonase
MFVLGVCFAEESAWQSEVGAKSGPTATTAFKVNDYGALSDGNTDSTAAIQKTIDACSAAGGGVIEFAPGQYVTGSLVLKSNMEFHLAEGVELLGAETDEAFPVRPTRAAGVEMDWPAAMLCVFEASNVKITGPGKINARGKRWWDKFTAARPEYEKKKLRWAVDYDIGRPYLLQIFKSNNVTVDGVTLIESPFWSVHVCYSEHVTVQNVTVRNNDRGLGPSTDGINIDSSRYVLVQHCDVDCNDDCYTLKSGMNADGLRVNKPVEYVFIHDCISRKGHGVITIGSDMSGGVRHIEVARMKGIGTNEGIRLKSARVRGGVVEDVLIHDIDMENVPRPIVINLDWFPQYSYPVLPDDPAEIKPHWHKLAEKVPAEKGMPHFREVTLRNVEAVGAKTGIFVNGLMEAPAEAFHLENVHVHSAEPGTVTYAKDWTLNDVTIEAANGKSVIVKECEGVNF